LDGGVHLPLRTRDGSSVLLVMRPVIPGKELLMGGSRACSVLVALSAAALCVAGAHPVAAASGSKAGATGSKAGPLAAPGIQAQADHRWNKAVGGPLQRPEGQ
jgi:hypothetical protein